MLSVQDHLDLAAKDLHYFDRPDVRLPNGNLVSDEAAAAARIQTMRDFERLMPGSTVDFTREMGRSLALREAIRSRSAN